MRQRAARGGARDGARRNGAGRADADRLRRRSACRSPARRVRVFLLVAVLSYSRRLFVKAFLHERQDDWREGIAAAFTHFGGVPRTVLGDNARALVRRPRPRDRHGHVPSGLPGLLPRLGRAAARVRAVSRADQGQDGVRREVRQAQRAGRPAVRRRSPRSRRTSRRGWPMADQRVHGTTHEAPMRALRRATSARRCGRCRRARCRGASSGCGGAWRTTRFVDVDTVRYSVPHRLVRDHVEVAVDEQTVRIFHGTDARRHARAIARAATRASIDPAHCAGLWRPAHAASRRRRPRRWPRSGATSPTTRRSIGRWPMSVVIHARVVEHLHAPAPRLRRRAARRGAQ